MSSVGGEGGSSSIERDLFLRVVALNIVGAKRFMPDAVKVICIGQADPTRYKFGARQYYLFQTWAEYQAYLREGGAS